jgi:hypothetical protein
MWQVVQHYGWRDRSGKPFLSGFDNVVKFSSRYWIVTVLWKYFNYDLTADPCWQASFVWEVIKDGA